MSPDTVLRDAVESFVAETSQLLGVIERSTSRRRDLEQAAAVDAAAIVGALFSADDHFSDLELAALSEALSTWLPELSIARVQKTGRRNELLNVPPLKPSLLFETLLQADRAHETSDAWRYYELALGIAHAACAVEVTPTRAKLLVIDAYRAALLARLHDSAIARPNSAAVVTRPARAVSGRDDQQTREPAAGRHNSSATGPEPLDSVVEELEDLIGLDAVKTEVRLLLNFARIEQLRRERGLPVTAPTRHLVMVGNPGTGKTTVARIVARVMHSLGVISKGHLVETDRSGLVAGYVGQTATKVNEIVDRSLGGVLFIDEAYSLVAGSNDFGSEAVATLLKRMEDDRDDLIVILAGYTAPMSQLLDSNPGLRSRFPRTIAFPDYTDAELLSIFDSLCKTHGYEIDDSTREAAQAWFHAQPRDLNFGNGRLVRNLFEASLARQATRLSTLSDPTNATLMTLTPEDIDEDAGDNCMNPVEFPSEDSPG